MADSSTFKTLRIIPRDNSFLITTKALKGSIFYDKNSNSLRIFDGVTTGGYDLARADLSNISNATFLAKANSAGVGGIQTGIEGRLAYYPANGAQINDLAEVYWHTHNGASMLHIDGLIDISGAKNRIRFHWDTLSDLNAEVNPSSYHGMLAHVHETGYVYFAHNGVWNKLANDGDLSAAAKSGSYTDLTNKPNIPTNLDSLTDVTITSASIGEVLKYNGTSWINDAELSSIDWTQVTGKPTFASVATSGNYSDLSNTPSAYGSTSINALGDVDTTTTPPTPGQVLKWNGTNWVPGTDATTGGAGTDADTLDGFDSSYYLNFNNLSNKPNIFSTIAVDGQNNVVADSGTDTLTLVGGTGISITTNNSSDSITITSTVSNTTYGISAETNGSNADIRLTGSDASTDNLTLAAGSNVTITRTDASTITIAATAASVSTFSTIAVAGQSNVVADGSSDTLTLVAGTNITITTDASTDTITINSSGGGASSNSFATIAVAGQSNVVADSSTDTLTLSAGTGIVINTNESTDTISITNGITQFTSLTDVVNTSMTIDQAYLPAITRLVVTANGSSAYRFDQYGATDDPTIYAISGTTIAFNLNAATGHPFLIQTAVGVNYNDGLIHVDTNGAVSSGANAQGKTSGTLYWKIPYNTTGNYRYQCQAHGAMQGTINIRDISAI